MTNKYMYFIANWKMFGNLKTINSLNNVINFKKKFNEKKFKVIYCPPSTLLYPLSIKLKSTSIEMGGQNCHESINFGPNTGQINSKLLKNVGAKYVILGHSENRQLGEDDNLINKKVHSALKNDLKVILCIGETLKQKKKKITTKILSKQILKGLKNVKYKKKILIAYEPTWAIGTGLVPKEKELSKIIGFIKNKLKRVQVLYGGSVNRKNITNLKKINNLDGFLIGGASLNSKNFIDIIKKTFN
tara:strand:+ start:992 stop:1726 length:735 start_codon:yes stop_codon:yes gene_type:complete